jgi:hypothetical protein
MVPQAKKALEIERLASELGERERSVFFLDWVSYEDRESLLSEAWVGAVLHPLHLETRFSVRTRVLDYIWAGLPIVITEGDVMSELVREKGLGRVVPAQHPGAVAEALVDLLSRPKSDWAAAFAACAESLRWSRVVQPILHYCLEGGYAQDRLDRRAAGRRTAASSSEQPSLLSQAWKVWRIYGLREVIMRTYKLLRWQRIGR